MERVVLSMHNTMKVVRWEIKRNVKNKSFIIGLFLTPAIIAMFLFLPTLWQEEKATSGITVPPALLEQVVPVLFAGVILLSIVYTGMMTFQSASQERKDKMAEIILSSLTPGELMQGKIIGYFILGLIQVLVWMGLAAPIIIWKFGLSIVTYLFTIETVILVLIAILGYLLFSALFVGLGATMEDVSASGSFQGMVLMLPFVPIIFIQSVLEEPNGLVAQVASYIPFTSPSVLIFRLTLLEQWPWIEIATSIAILIVSVWIFTKFAGKIFKIGIQKYGKNATPKEIWKWLWTG